MAAATATLVHEIDALVILRARQQDQLACRQIIEALQRPVFATIHRFLGSRYRDQIEDIAQEVFLKLFRSLDRFDLDRGVKFTTWAFTFVRNHCFDVLKKRRLKAVSLTLDDDGEEGQRDLPDPAIPRAADAAVNSELGREIEAALQELNEEQRLAFVLREYQGLDYHEIATAMNTTTGTIKSRIFRAKAALRERLAPYLETGS